MIKVPLWAQIGLALTVGALGGLTLNYMGEVGQISGDTALALAEVGRWMGKVFLALLSMVVVPLIFSSLVGSIARVGRSGDLRRMGGLTLGYYLLTSLLAILVGIGVVNLIRPGEGLDYQTLLAAAQAGGAEQVTPELAHGSAGAVLVDVFYRMVPTNVVEAASSNTSILSVIFFAVLVGLATARVETEHGEPLLRLMDAVYEVMTRITHWVLRLAPLGIFGYVFFVTAATGYALARPLSWYMLTVALGLGIHALITLPLALSLLAGRSPLAYAGAMREALITAFSTASSSGTLPLTLQSAVERGGIPRRVAAFTLPLGATVNMDGTALYEAVAVLFIAQMIAPLSLAQQGVVAVTALLASVGAAGIPHAGTVMMVIVMGAVGIPSEGVLVILAVDRVLDMMRTSVNVWSDAVGAAVVARWSADDVSGRTISSGE
ncbi:MAG: dicarboxylate/amino acid:cation symporter [Deltaproteobacteria bacterium]|nr:dicarboxylate/amino acid:cation symporter [Deltaproteobacteria bacterium]